MPFDSNAYHAEWHRRNPGKAHEYYLRTHPNAKTLESLYAEAAARTQKACSRCALIKPLTEFGVSKKSRDGRASRCSDCLRVSSRAQHLKVKMAREALRPKEILPEGQKRCNRCETVRPKDAFGHNTRICRQCDREYAKAAYQKNPQKSKDYHRQWCKDNPEEIKELRRAAYRRANPSSKSISEVKAEREAKAKRSEKPCKKCGIVKPIDRFGLSKKTNDGRQYQCLDCFAERSRQQYASNPKLLEKAKRWSKAHPEVTRQVAQVRRARKLGIAGSHTLAQWLALCKKFKNRCVRCGKTGKLTRDHIIPISDQHSSHDISNIQPLCYSCNSSKNNRYSVDFRNTPFTMAGQHVMF